MAKRRGRKSSTSTKIPALEPDDSNTAKGAKAAKHARGIDEIGLPESTLAGMSQALTSLKNDLEEEEILNKIKAIQDQVDALIHLAHEAKTKA